MICPETELNLVNSAVIGHLSFKNSYVAVSELNLGPDLGLTTIFSYSFGCSISFILWANFMLQNKSVIELKVRIVADSSHPSHELFQSQLDQLQTVGLTPLSSMPTMKILFKDVIHHE